MTELYLPIEDSLGYKIVREALLNVFHKDLDNIEIIRGEYENFGFKFSYKNYDTIMWLASTRKNVPFEYGEGGNFTISVPNPKYPSESFLETIYFHNLLTDRHLRDQVKYVFGKNKGTIENALLIFKNYVDVNNIS
ncbi:hypothetical protein ACVRXX_07070 [Streptococcus plurextorum]